MKVICIKAKTCSRYCGAKFPHDNRDCEPCPLDGRNFCRECKEEHPIIKE